MAPSKDPSTKCGRKNRRGLPCANPKGFATDHPGTGACHNHGGDSPGAPEGNKNAVTTGEYEKIHYSALPPEEQALWEQQDKVDPRIEVERAIKLISVREHRIQLRITKTRRAEEDPENKGLALASETRQKGTVGWEKTSLLTTESRPIAETVMKLEDALGRVQNLKVRYIDQLRAILKENPSDSGGLEAIVEVLDRSASKIAANRERAEAYARELDEADGGVLG